MYTSIVLCTPYLHIYLLYPLYPLYSLYPISTALTGFAGSVIFPYFIKIFKIYNTALLSIAYQFILVAIAGLSFFFASRETSVLIVIYAVLLSRSGLWLFDLCVRQIAQESIPENSRGVVNGQWKALISFFNMSTFVCALFFPEPSDFWLLCLVSAVMVGIHYDSY